MFCIPYNKIIFYTFVGLLKIEYFKNVWSLLYEGIKDKRKGEKYLSSAYYEEGLKRKPLLKMPHTVILFGYT